MRASLATVVAAVWLCSACAPEAEGGGAVGGGAGVGFAGTGGSGGGGWNGACVTFETRPCMCDATFAGRQVCSSAVWSACACDGVVGTAGVGGGLTGPGEEPAANKRADVMWNWTASMPAGGCRPGHYEGTFEGLYASSLTVVGAPIPVAPIDLPGMPGLEFDLVAGAGGGEILVVSGGKMKGNALGLFPFEFDMVGSLDCDTLKFEAELINGFYSLGGVGMFEMEGPIVADYDPVTGTMTNGHWIVTEPGSMPPWGSTTPWYGGEGTWRAMFIRP